MTGRAFRESRLDPTDQALVRLLRSNARLPISALAREVNLSRTAVQARIGRLERDGVLIGYQALLGQDVEAGLRAIVALRIGVRPCRIVLDKLRAWPEIIQGYSTAGDTDAVLIVRVTSTSALSELSDRVSLIEGVDGVVTTLILATFAAGRD